MTKRAIYRSRIQNLAAAAILLAGGFVGSLFVDITHFVLQDGFSQKAVRSASVIMHDGRTWVAYAEAPVTVTVLDDRTCGECTADKMLSWMRYTMPTIAARRVDIADPEGQRIAATYGIAAVPAYVFDGDAVTRTPFYAQAEKLFDRRADGYVLRLGDMGMMPGRIVDMPRRDVAAAEGPMDAPVTITLFADLTSNETAAVHRAIGMLVREKPDATVYQVFALADDTTDARVREAYAGAVCAAAQQRLMPYLTTLVANQRQWRFASAGFATLQARRAGVADQKVFAQCMTDHADALDRSATEAGRFAIGAAPVVLVNRTVLDGTVAPITPEALQSAVAEARAGK